MRFTTSRMVVLIAAVALVATASPALADTSHRAYPDSIRIEGTTIELAGYDLASYEGVELLLLEIGKVQGSDDISFLDNDDFPATLRARIYETLTRESEPTIEESHGVYSPAASRALAADLLLEGPDAKPPTESMLSGYTCGWGYKKVSYRPGLITYYWFELKTSFCWNGTRIQSTPVQAVNGDGSWGWSYEGCAICTVVGIPSPTKYESYAKGEMNIGVGPASHTRWPWIKHVVNQHGTVWTSYHD